MKNSKKKMVEEEQETPISGEGISEQEDKDQTEKLKTGDEDVVDEKEKLKAEIDSLKDSCLRAAADFQNLKKRTEKEKADIYKFANEKLMVELLTVVDNIDRALAHVQEDADDSLVSGLKMIRKSLGELMDRNGVETIEAVGAPFDPELHHAVQMVPSEEHQTQHVMEEYQKGYKLNGKVIRHSMVKVSE